MSITKIFWLWLIVWVVFFGLAALINGARLLDLIFGYSIISVIAAFLCTLIHFGVQQFLKKDSITPSLRSQHPDTHTLICHSAWRVSARWLCGIISALWLHFGDGVTCHRSADQLSNSQEKKTWHSM